MNRYPIATIVLAVVATIALVVLAGYQLNWSKETALTEPGTDTDQEITVTPAAIAYFPEKRGVTRLPSSLPIAKQQVSQLLSEISRQLGATRDDQILTLDRVQQAVSENLLRDKQPETLVAAVLQRELMTLKRNASDSRAMEFTPASTYLLLPYLAEAGLCSGDLWSTEGMTCGYSNAVPGAARIQGA